MPLATERTSFSLDILGRYTATSQEVVDGADTARDPHARPFDLIIIGGGTFGCALAAPLFSRDRTRQPLAPPLTWNTCEIRVSGDEYAIQLNGSTTTTFTNDTPTRGRGLSDDPRSGFIGPQPYPRPGAVASRHIRIKPLG
ncbi:MAG TPA: family 16 glycoside hydrolase [Nitriliruptorales bacterium]|nr:family 16 glycoside hydrolase [Nitriliruptorales bacterium]